MLNAVRKELLRWQQRVIFNENYLNNYKIECYYLNSDKEFLLKEFDKIQDNNTTRKEFERILTIVRWVIEPL